MKIVTVENYEEMSALAAKIIGQSVQSNPTATLGLATGSTVLGTYANLRQAYASGQLSFKDIRTINLDEYVGLGCDHEHSYAYYMLSNLFDHIDIDRANTFIPRGDATDLEAECQRYGDLLAKLPRDIQLLGIGSDGHIAFNEPGSPFDSRTRVVQLATSTIKDNSRLFSRIEDVPTRAITVGIADIMCAKKLLLLASGLNKAKAVKAMLQGAVDTCCPASILQTHTDVTVILDKQAASLL
ncbi:MAG: glucosamine-6-phosphate deaminase [Clostridiales bacterium]|nr:glucosamine-6-phosphate deaminase [Clostridiales bacterium]